MQMLMQKMKIIIIVIHSRERLPPPSLSLSLSDALYAPCFVQRVVALRMRCPTTLLVVVGIAWSALALAKRCVSSKTDAHLMKTFQKTMKNKAQAAIYHLLLKLQDGLRRR